MGSFVDTVRHISHRAFHELYLLCSHEGEQKIISDNANRWDGIKAAHAAAALFWCFGAQRRIKRQLRVLCFFFFFLLTKTEI